jgi:hypothetical protein
MEVSPECPIDEPPAEYADVVNDIKSKLDTMGVNDLIKVLEQVKAIKEKPVVQEQVGTTILIAGVAVPTVAVAAVAGLIALIIIVKLGKLIFRGGKRQNATCKKRNRLLRRFGIEGYFR